MTLQKTPLLTFLLLLHHVVIGADRVENIDSQLLRCCVLRSCYLATGLLAESSPNNCFLCWLHSSFLKQIRHITLHILGVSPLLVIKVTVTYVNILFMFCSQYLRLCSGKVWKNCITLPFVISDLSETPSYKIITTSAQCLSI
jgi:hypothetical protein